MIAGNDQRSFILVLRVALQVLPKLFQKAIFFIGRLQIYLVITIMRHIIGFIKANV